MDIMYKHKMIDSILSGKTIDSVYEGIAKDTICICFTDHTFVNLKLAENSEIKIQTVVKPTKEREIDEINRMIEKLQLMKEVFEKR